MESLGTLGMWRVKIKPGNPLASGQINGAPFLGLPGNPAAQSIPVKAGFKWTAGKRREFVRARLTQDSDAQTVAQI